MPNEPKHQTINVTFPFQDIQIWQKFVVGLKMENRFTLSDVTAKFIGDLIDFAREHKSVQLPLSTPLCRARINSREGTRTFTLEEMGMPPRDLAGHGRLNPRGIPYLYLASDRTTAISEVRPWVGCDLTLAEFVLTASCHCINFSKKHFVNQSGGSEGAEFTWRELITWMFSAPFDPRDDTAYIPTQYLAERIKGAGFSGIIYDSALSQDGYNVALFDENLAKASSLENAHVTSIDVISIITAPAK